MNRSLAGVNIFSPAHNVVAVKGDIYAFRNITNLRDITAILRFIIMFFDNSLNGFIDFKFFERVFLL